MGDPEVRPAGDRLIAQLHVRLTPKAALDRIDGWGEDETGRPILMVRVRAAPVEGKANAALVSLIAKTLGVAAGRVEVARGGVSRVKALEVEGMTLEVIREQLK